MSTVGERPAFRDHSRFEIQPGGATHGYDSNIAVPIPFLECDAPSPDSTRKRARRLTAARPPFAAGPAPVLALLCIDPVQADPNTARLERVAVNNARVTHEHTSSAGGSYRLFVSGFHRLLAHRDPDRRTHTHPEHPDQRDHRASGDTCATPHPRRFNSPRKTSQCEKSCRDRSRPNREIPYGIM